MFLIRNDFRHRKHREHEEKKPQRKNIKRQTLNSVIVLLLLFPILKVAAYGVESGFLSEYLFYNQSQNQSVEEIHSHVYYHQGEYGLTFDINYLKRNFSVINLYDSPMTVGLSYKHHERHKTEVLFGMDTDPDFSFKRSMGFSHEIQVTNPWYMGFGVRLNEYTDKNTTLLSLYSGLYKGNGHFFVKLLVPIVDDSEPRSALLLKGQYYYEALTPELWFACGKDEASRPYLTGHSNSFFKEGGVKISWEIYNKMWKLFLYGSRKEEEAFQQDMIGIGMLYLFGGTRI